uniref:Uncharacterized protein n=1 Tax=Anguilla anguilla TaxID=7936 RepID=A0A0E9SZ22_ANGAN
MKHIMATNSSAITTLQPKLKWRNVRSDS